MNLNERNNLSVERKSLNESQKDSKDCKYDSNYNNEQDSSLNNHLLQNDFTKNTNTVRFSFANDEAGGLFEKIKFSTPITMENKEKVDSSSKNSGGGIICYYF